MANRTDPLAKQVHGSNPQFLIEKILRLRIYANRYWKEQCFGLTAETLVDRAVMLEYMGGSASHNVKPTPFVCLLLKLLQIQPTLDIVFEYIKQEDYKYLRALGAFYVRMVARPAEVYRYLEPLLEDYSKLAKRSPNGWDLVHMDEYIDELLTSELCCDITLPVLPKRSTLESAGYLEPRASSLDVALQEQGEREGTDGEPTVVGPRAPGPAVRDFLLAATQMDSTGASQGGRQADEEEEEEAEEHHESCTCPSCRKRHAVAPASIASAAGVVQEPVLMSAVAMAAMPPPPSLQPVSSHSAAALAAPALVSARPDAPAVHVAVPAAQQAVSRPMQADIRSDRDRDRDTQSGRDADRDTDRRRDGDARRDFDRRDRYRSSSWSRSPRGYRSRSQSRSRSRDRYRDRDSGVDRYDRADAEDRRDSRRPRSSEGYRDRDDGRRDRSYDGRRRDRSRSRSRDRYRDLDATGPGPGRSGVHVPSAAAGGRRRNEFGEWVDHTGRPIRAGGSSSGPAGSQGQGQGEGRGQGVAGGHQGQGAGGPEEGSVDYWNAMRAKLGLKPLK